MVAEETTRGCYIAADTDAHNLRTYSNILCMLEC